MSREQQIAERFESLRTDKGAHGYAPIYASLPEDISSILEIGIYWGGSLLTWREFFPQAEIYGVDINLSLLKSPESPWNGRQDSKIHLFEDDIRVLEPGRYPDVDLIIDDGTHEVNHVLSIWDKLHKKARKFYIIEDVYYSRMDIFWKRIARDAPHAQIMFWRTSDHCGDERILPDSDSQCIVVKF